MSGLQLTLIIILFAVNCVLTVVKEKAADKAWYKNWRLVLGVISLLFVAAIGITTYQESKRSKQQANDRAEEQKREISTLSDRAEKLKDEILALNGQNRTLGDQIGDCNARIEAVRTKLHAPAHFKRDVSEKLNLRESVTAVPNKK